MRTDTTFLSVSFRRTYNIGNYESMSLEATVQVRPDYPEQMAIEDARAFVEQQFAMYQQPKETAGVPPAQRITDTDAPATEKQRAYMEYLRNELGWNNDRLLAFAAEHDWNILTITRRECSELIDRLKGVQAAGDSSPVAAQTRRVPEAERATRRQLRALERLMEERRISESEARADMRRIVGHDIEIFSDLSMDEAGQLLSEWQQRPRKINPMKRT